MANCFFYDATPLFAKRLSVFPRDVQFSLRKTREQEHLPPNPKDLDSEMLWTSHSHSPMHIGFP